MIGVSVGVACGLVLSPASFAGDPARMFVTFIGLVSASILPTISLAIGSMSGTGRSVQKIVELHEDLAYTTQALFRLLVLVGFVFAALVIFSMAPVVEFCFTIRGWTPVIPDVFRRIIQACLFGSAALTIIDALRIPATFYKVLKIKRDIAVFEAQKDLQEKAPPEASIRTAFKTKEGFGKTVNLDQLRK